MTDQTHLWELMKDNPTCMMVTQEPDGALRARPMRAVFEREAGEIWFYTRLASGKSAELAQDGHVCLCFEDVKKNNYVSVSGRAALVADKGMVHKHWSRFVDAWFPEGPDGADVGMIRVAVDKGEFWDSDSSDTLAALKMLRASATDETPDLGENRKVG